MEKALSHILIITLSIFILINIWWSYYEKRIREHIKEETRDYGVILLVLAMCTWALVSMLRILPNNVDADELEKYIAFQKSQPFIVKEVTRHFLSFTNNLLFIYAISYFDHGIGWLKKTISRKTIFITVGAFSFIVFILICFLLYYDISNYLACNIIDTCYSTVTFIFLMGVLYSSFTQRGFHLIAYVSIFTMVIAIISQWINAFNVEILMRFARLNEKENINLYKNISGSLYIASLSTMASVFIALTYSWVMEKIFIADKQQISDESDANENAIKILKEYGESVEEIKNYLRELIAKNKLNESIAILKMYFAKKSDDNNLKIVITKERELRHIEHQMNSGVIERKDYIRVLNEITKVLLDLIDEVK